jgi:hypothetical protein
MVTSIVQHGKNKPTITMACWVERPAEWLFFGDDSSTTYVETKIVDLLLCKPDSFEFCGNWYYKIFGGLF